jgi:hypothetical protein
MQTTETSNKTLVFRLDLEADANDTGLIGHFPAIHGQILASFGPGRPNYDTWKSSCEWSFSDDQGGLYFLYDWNPPRKRTIKKLQCWHVGGNKTARENYPQFHAWLKGYLHYAWTSNLTPVVKWEDHREATK